MLAPVSEPTLALTLPISDATREAFQRELGVPLTYPQFGPVTDDRVFVETAFLEWACYMRSSTDVPGCVRLHLGGGAARLPRPHRIVPATPMLRVPGLSTCACDPLACDCSHYDVVDFGLDVGLYSPETIVAALLRTRTGEGYAIYPKIAGIAGRVGESFEWHVPAQGTVAFRRSGDPVPFLTADPMFHRGPYRGANFSLSGEVIAETKLLRAYKLSYYAPAEAEHSTPDVPEPWSYTQADGVYTTVSGVPNNVAAQWASLRICRIQLYGSLICLGADEDHSIVISKDIAFDACRTFGVRSREPGLLTSVHRYVNGAYSKISALPPDVKHRAQVATIAFVLANITQEASVLAQVSQDMTSVWHVHREALAFRAPWVVRAPQVAAGTAYIAFSCYTIESLASHFTTLAGHVVSGYVTSHQTTITHAVVSTKMMTAGFIAAHLPLVLPVWALATAAGYLYTKSHGMSPSVSLTAWAQTPTDTYARLPPGVYHTTEPLSFGHTDAVKRAIPPQQRGSIVHVHQPRMGPAEQNKLSLVGIGFDVAPRYFESTLENEATSLLARLSLRVPDPVPGLWNKVADAYLAHPLNVDLDTVLKHPENAHYLSRSVVCSYAAKFPIDRRNALVEAYDAFCAAGRRFHRSDFKSSQFVKGELHLKTLVMDSEHIGFVCEDGTPRSIIAFKPVVNAVLGPAVWQYCSLERAHRLQALASDAAPPGFAPRGVSGEHLGQWLTEVVTFLGGEEQVITLSGDSVKHDAHHGKDSLKAASRMSVLRLEGLPRFVKDGLEMQQACIVGVSSHGVVYRVRWKRASGSSDTEAGNSASTESKSAYATSSPVRSSEGWVVSFVHVGCHVFIAAQGDDVYIVMSKRYAMGLLGVDEYRQDRDASRVAAHVVGQCLELGFEDEFKVYEGVDGDFCSRWWYPTLTGYLPGGKIGRTLAKAGYMLNHRDAQTVRSAAIGLYQDNAHVPFLREYFARVKELAVGRLGGRPNEHTIHMAAAHEYDAATLDFVNAKYGLTQGDLDDFVFLLMQVTSLPVVISWPLLDRCLLIDYA
jgi:hypothetical protein